MRSTIDGNIPKLLFVGADRAVPWASPCAKGSRRAGAAQASLSLWEPRNKENYIHKYPRMCNHRINSGIMNNELWYELYSTGEAR